MAVKPGEFKHTLAVGAGKRDMPDQCDLGFGKRAGLVGASFVHAAKVMDRGKALNDHFLLGHTHRAACEGDRYDHRQELGRETHRESKSEQEALQ